MGLDVLSQPPHMEAPNPELAVQSGSRLVVPMDACSLVLARLALSVQLLSSSLIGLARVVPVSLVLRKLALAAACALSRSASSPFLLSLLLVLVLLAGLSPACLSVSSVALRLHLTLQLSLSTSLAKPLFLLDLSSALAALT